MREQIRSSYSPNNVHKQSKFRKVWVLSSKHMKKYIEMSPLLSVNCKNLHSLLACLCIRGLESFVEPLHQFFSIYMFIPGSQRISHFLSFHWIFLVCVCKIRDWLRLTLCVLLQYLLENTCSISKCLLYPFFISPFLLPWSSPLSIKY